LQRELSGQIGDVREDKLEISELPAGPEIRGALIVYPGIGGFVAPASNDVEGVGILGHITDFKETFRNPGTTQLVLLAEFVSVTGAYDRDIAKPFRKVPNHRHVVSQTSKKY